MEENNLQILNAIKDSTNKIIEEIRVNSDLIIKENQLNSIIIERFSEEQKNKVTELKRQYYELKEQNRYKEAQEKIKELVNYENNTREEIEKADNILNVTVNPMYQIEEDLNSYTFKVNGTITNNDSKNLSRISVSIAIYSYYDDVRLGTINNVYYTKLNSGETALISGYARLSKSLVVGKSFKYKVEYNSFWYEY